MSPLQAIIRLQQIRDEINGARGDHSTALVEEFTSLKSALLDSPFAFNNVKELIHQVESMIEGHQQP